MFLGLGFTSRSVYYIFHKEPRYDTAQFQGIRRAYSLDMSPQALRFCLLLTHPDGSSLKAEQGGQYFERPMPSNSSYLLMTCSCPCLSALYF